MLAGPGGADVVDLHARMTPKRFWFNIGETPQEFGWSVGNDRVRMHSRLAVS